MRDLLVDGITAFDGALNVGVTEIQTMLLPHVRMHTLLWSYAPPYQRRWLVGVGGKVHHVCLSPRGGLSPTTNLHNPSTCRLHILLALVLTQRRRPCSSRNTGARRGVHRSGSSCEPRSTSSRTMRSSNQLRSTDDDCHPSLF